MKRLLIYSFLLLSVNLHAQITATVGQFGSGADFSSFQEAFNYFNICGLDNGDVVLQIIDNVIESSTAVLYESGHDGLSFYSSMTIYPTVTNLSISGDITGPLIEVNGATTLVIDGSLNGGGSVKDLKIINSNTGSSASTIKFANSASGNMVKNCVIKGSSTATTGGVMYFGDTSGASGNNNNTIDNNDLTRDAGGRPINMIFSLGLSGADNSSNTISNNHFYDFLALSASAPGISCGIFLSSNTTAWTISGNSFYDSGLTPTGTVTYYVIQISNTSGGNFAVTGNSIGGNAASCSGVWTKTADYNTVFTAINLSVGTSPVSNIQGNIIKSFSWSNTGSAKWTGINIENGAVNIGTSSGNFIGEATGNGSVTFTSATSSPGSFYGINIASSGTIDCEKNTIGSVTVTNSDTRYANHFYGVTKTSTPGITTISNNIIGSEATSNSINASSLCSSSNQFVIGIYSSGSGTININNNKVCNITNANTYTSSFATGYILGIVSSSGTNTISGNTIDYLTIANNNKTSSSQPSAGGIMLSGSTLKTVTFNTIHHLSNTYASFAGSIIGIVFTGNSGSNKVSENLIHTLTTNSSTGTIYGIKMAGGSTTYANNVIRIGENKAATVFGIYDTGGSGNDSYLYFNTVYIGGTAGSSTNKSYAIYSLANTNTRDFRNNILINKRSTSSGSYNYALYIVSAGGTITCDYNDYYVYGTGTILGYYAVDKPSLPIVQDIYSYSVDPVFTTDGGTNAADYNIGADLIGISGTGIITDYGLATRNNPTMGAWERVVNTWTGLTSTDWSTLSNWSAGTKPLDNSNVVFAVSPLNDCYLDVDHSVNVVTNASGKKLITNGHMLSIKGNLVFSGGAQIDATTTSSTVAYTGTSAQTIDAANFASGKSYNLSVNNGAGVTLNTDFTVDNNLTISSGKLTVSAGKLLTVTGTLTNSVGITGLVIKSDANGNEGKLINNTASVSGTVELYMTGGAGTQGPLYHRIVPPVQSVSIGPSNPPTIQNVRDYLLLSNSFVGDLLAYSESAAGGNIDMGWQYFDGYTTGGYSYAPFNFLYSTMGYSFRVTANDKITFTGTLNNAPTVHTFNLSRSSGGLGYNLVGNPYPCSYDIHGIAELVNTGDNVDNTVYFNNDGGWAYYNVGTGAGTTGYTSIVPPMQGFFVRVAATGTPSLTLPIASKTANPASPLRSKGLTLVKKLKLVLNNGAIPDETIVCLIDKATSGFDSDYDAYKMFGSSTTVPSIYTELNGVKYAINSIPDPGSEITIIPLSVVIRTPGSYTINTSEFENLDGINVSLRHGTDQINLSKNATYTFNSGTGTFTDFQIIFGNTITKIDNTITKTIFKTWYSNNFLYISCPDEMRENKSSAVIYDIQGKAVYTNNLIYLAPGQTIQVPLNLPYGVYIVRVTAENNSYVSKIVVY